MNTHANQPAAATSSDSHDPIVPAVDTNQLHWVPLKKGLSFKPLRFYPDGSGYQLLLRLEPGVTIPPHRHTDEVHAYNVSGSRRIITTGDIIGPDTYLYEPPGNHDTWEAYGDQPCVVHIEAKGRVEYLDADGEMVRYTDASTAKAEYLQWCADHDIAPNSAILPDR